MSKISRAEAKETIELIKDIMEDKSNGVVFILCPITEEHGDHTDSGMQMIVVGRASLQERVGMLEIAKVKLIEETR